MQHRHQATVLFLSSLQNWSLFSKKHISKWGKYKQTLLSSAFPLCICKYTHIFRYVSMHFVEKICLYIDNRQIICYLSYPRGSSLLQNEDYFFSLENIPIEDYINSDCYTKQIFLHRCTFFSLSDIL